ncbi:RNA-binding RNA annealing protein [Pleosporales sp. CAS-2024a]
MSSKLDTSLDDILKTRRQTKSRGRGGRRPDATRPAPSGPVGGVAKSTKPTKQAKAAPSAVIPEISGKILVSGLPHDVDQNQLQDYFATAVGVGRPKKVLLQYGPTGRSLGSATIIFNKHEQAVKATSALNGVKIDGRPVRVEMLVSAANLPAAVAQPSLADRVTQAKKDKPKPATAAKTAPASVGKGRGRGGKTEGRGGRGGRNPRERTKKKTVEELDTEMADYFAAGDGNTDAAAAGVAQTTTAVGDSAMDDEML